MENHGNGSMGWLGLFHFVERLPNRWKTSGFPPKIRTPPAGSAGGVRRKPKNFRIGNYLPASMGSLPDSSRLGIPSGSHPFVERSMPWNIPRTGDHKVGCGCLGYDALRFMCAESFEEIWIQTCFVNPINEKNSSSPTDINRNSTPVSLLRVLSDGSLLGGKRVRCSPPPRPSGQRRRGPGSGSQRATGWLWKHGR